MANSYTTAQGSVSSNTITFPIEGHAGHIYLLLDYAKGDGTSVALSYIELYDPVTADWLKVPAAIASGTTLGVYTLTVNATAKYFIFLDDVGLNFEKIRFTFAFTGGTTQVLGVNILID